MHFIRRKRLWGKGKEGVYVVSPNASDLSSGKEESKTRKRSYDSDTRTSISSRGSLTSLDTNGDYKQQNYSRKSSFGNGYGSLDSLPDEQVWDSISMEEKAVRLLSTHRRQSVDPKEIQVKMYDTVASPGRRDEEEDPPVDPMDEETLAHVHEVVASILERYKQDDSDSDSSTAVSENSELDFNVSSDEESEPDDERGEVFDFDAHIKNICKRNYGSDSESDGNESVTSEKAFKTAVRKAMKKIKRERSDELAASDKESEKGSENERSPKSDDISSCESSDQDGDESDSSSGDDERDSFEMTRDVDPEIQELMAGGLVIDLKKGKSGAGESRTIYRYYMNNEGRIDAVSETADNLSEEDEGPSTVNTQENTLASTLEDSKAQELRWPFSNFYVKEINQEATFSENSDALPSYRSTLASASHPGRKRNVMLGRIWWVEWWAREDTKTKSSAVNTSTTSL